MSLLQKKNPPRTYKLPKFTTLFGLTTAVVALIGAVKQAKKEVITKKRDA